ncbi:beta-propeller fold lactonase family protein [Nakamurella flavida]|uniref:Beta-propeller fold lactonase family protein n=1 Tax=Nakamurella flavida TaxID=363630 RepID=A0A938YPV3_9ACTN|nr:beta-propeller fold lactonase family protein [Nakamurella flavida]MBM9476785.1 beta-propeller fold lactonase family protein [Nakamurella flavida]MDP9778777.1 6-phosphogluconolactonase (cycloisomerase 2 family) [Nakamurella flavida]
MTGTDRPAAWVGCFTRGTGGQGERVEVVRRVGEVWRGPARRPAVEPPVISPSFLVHAPVPDRLYAVSEAPEGELVGYRIEPDGTAVPDDRVASGGSFPCHLAVAPGGAFLVTAHYGSGTVAVHALDGAGRLGRRTDLLAHTGNGPDPDRQEGPHPHQAVFVGDLLLVPDLGLDVVRSYRLDAHGRLAPAGPDGVLPPGFGPRHLVALPGGRIAVVGELAGAIALLALDPVTAASTLLDVAATTGRSGRCAPSGIGVDPAGRWVAVANRGVETVAVFAVPAPGQGWSPPRETWCGGTEPRDLTVDGDRIHVANQHGGGLITLQVLPGGGGSPAGPTIRRTGRGVALGSPTCVLPARPAR